MSDQEPNTNDEQKPPEQPAPEGAARDEQTDPEAMAGEALAAAEAAVADLQGEAGPDDTKAQPFNYERLKAEVEAGAKNPNGLSLISDVNLNVKIELGRTRMLVDDVVKLAEGSVVELDKLAGDPVDVFVNERHVARGEVLVLNDNFCVRINEILAPARIESSGSRKK
jgi:flagellar motor switch protein FliN/FliY